MLERAHTHSPLAHHRDRPPMRRSVSRRRPNALFLGAALLATAAFVSYVAIQQTEARHPPRGRMVPVRGGRLHVVDWQPEGEAHGTIVLLHGASINLEDLLQPLGERLRERFRIIAIDRPGLGWSDRPDGDADGSVKAQADLIRDALDELDTGPVMILGHSLAGAVAAQFALDHRNMVRGLVLLSGANLPWPSGRSMEKQRFMLPFMRAPVLLSTIAPWGLLFPRQLAKPFFYPQSPPRDYAEKVGLRLLMRPKRMRANMADMVSLQQGTRELEGRYESLSVPTLIIAGSEDKVVPLMYHEILHREIPGSSLVVLPGMGHMLHHFEGMRVAHEIQAFADRVRMKHDEREKEAVPAHGPPLEQ